MIDKVSIDMCCLCGNCANVCPKEAISFSKEENLFFYPVIDNDKCIDCGLCEKVCPSLKSLEPSTAIESYAVKNRDDEILKNSTSGGVFSALAQVVIENGGVVFGAAFTENFKVKHIAVDNLNDLSLLRGSKYVQSHLGDCFEKIKSLLKEGREVLFSGCPCQTAALKVFLSEQVYDGKLLLVDFICHGILGQDLFDQYITYLEKKKKSKIVEFSFRKKKYSWDDSGPEIIYENGKKIYWPLYEDIYMQGYFKSLCMRESCYTCKYKNFYSGADITLGDFWGAKQLVPEFYNPMGVSALCVQTEKGQQLLSKANNLVNIKDVDINLILKHNRGLVEPFPKGIKSEEFFALASKVGYINALIKISRVSFVEKIKRFYRKIRRKLNAK